MKKLGNKGFTLVEGLLITIVLLLIVGVGYYVYNSNSDKKDSPTKTAQTSSDQSKDNSTKPAKKYLEFKSAGVKMELTDEIKDAYTGTGGNNRGDVYISTHYFDSLPGFTDCTVDNKSMDGIAALDYARVGDDHFGTPWTEEDLKSLNTVNIDGTYYWITPGGAPCYDLDSVPENSPHIDKYNAVRAALTTQASTITKL